MDTIENAFDKVGLMQGTYAPLLRATTGAVMGSVVVFGFKPELMWNSDGTLRPWVITSPNDPNPTMFPWWMAVGLPAALFGVFV